MSADEAALDPCACRSGAPRHYREVLARLATVNELAQPFPITKQAVSKHIAVLESAGLVTRTKEAQRRPVHLDPAVLELLTAWIDRYRLESERNYRHLADLLVDGTEVGSLGAPASFRNLESHGRVRVSGGRGQHRAAGGVAAR